MDPSLDERRRLAAGMFSAQATSPLSTGLACGPAGGPSLLLLEIIKMLRQNKRQSPAESAMRLC
jgi:hypothetical protein